MSGTTIRKVVITEFGDASKVHIIQDTITPPPKNHVQVATIYSGFSGADINMRRGVYPMQNKAPLTPGYCLVGIVKTNEKYLIKVPAGIDLQQANALVLYWNTAYAMVFESAKVTAGQRVFIHGVSGAVGYALMKLCQLQGAQVYGTASERNHKVARAQGATPFVYTDKNWIKIMKDLGGADAVFDPLGFESWDESFSILSPTGILVGFGGNLPSLNDDSESRSVVMPAVKLLARDDARFEPNLKTLFGLIAKGKITVPINNV
ncbi:zinc-binding dehydrogenase [Colletotrichum graminicola M1.001]|uniref:Zinc-binding dehydrogenase n=1 Tax=Colletotrichum graminicola (strain M1.001 / M2 / FGSC 10212) TaxID=645133 RepID=E3QSI7_COLGM|nr:zinc-binding dehydrogenase [Colletotrichum graminicola M1.001]EFQ33825.1 zinc-binding dehydrogenase [Colletotrichum graminicola M1.001]